MEKKTLKNTLGDINYFTVMEMESKYSQYMFKYVDSFICKENELINENERINKCIEELYRLVKCRST